jgi:DNA-binding ferritin-like protein
MKHEVEFNTSDEYIRAYQLEEENQRKAEALAETMAEATHVYLQIANYIDQTLGYIEELKDAVPADYDDDISMLIIKAESYLQDAFDKAMRGVRP